MSLNYHAACISAKKRGFRLIAARVATNAAATHFHNFIHYETL